MPMSSRSLLLLSRSISRTLLTLTYLRIQGAKKRSGTAVMLQSEKGEQWRHALQKGLGSEYAETCARQMVGIYIHTYIHTYIHKCMHAYIHTYIHTYIHACMHAYIHTYVC
jgi:hypothetical protein